MRLIDAEHLVLRIDMHGTNKFGMLDEDVRKFISEQPTIDAVPVVRCKDCKYYWKNSKYEDDMDAVAMCLASPEDDAFCSEGERKDDE